MNGEDNGSPVSSWFPVLESASEISEREDNFVGEVYSNI